MKTEGVRMDAYAKYKDAVSACGSMDYIDCNLSQVARKFGLKGPALANFMRVHFPQTLVWREEVRRWMGINDNTPRGLLPKYEKQYADAVKLYETSDLSISEIAALCGVSSGGFGQHLRFYHHDLLKRKRQVRKKAQEKERKAYGELSGNGHRYVPYPKTLENMRKHLSLQGYDTNHEGDRPKNGRFAERSVRLPAQVAHGSGSGSFGNIFRNG